jgi:hypothetical protein
MVFPTLILPKTSAKITQIKLLFMYLAKFSKTQACFNIATITIIQKSIGISSLNQFKV